MSGENNNETTSTMTMLEKPILYVKDWFDGMDNVVKMAIGVILAVCLVACSWNILQFVFFFTKQPNFRYSWWEKSRFVGLLKRCFSIPNVG